MKIVVLGAAAGGGFPQWNSNGPGCRRARAGDPAAESRTQASIAVSAEGERWFLLNASPDLRQQIQRTPALHPRDGLRSTPIAGVVLTGGDVDVVAGLLTMRERQPFLLHATQRILGVLDDNPIFEVLARDVVERRAQALDRPFALDDALTATLFAVAGKVPLYLEEGDGMPVIQVDGTTVGLEIADAAGKRMLFIPGCAAFTSELLARIEGADLLFFDGTLWRDDEMVRAGLSHKTGRRMGHLSLGGPEGTIATLAGTPVGRKVIIHMNNSNPVLLADSPERAEAEAAGWIVGHDGLELSL
ncbi:pyrroloquinoline quinone biosynthesis protein PqqB [Sphingomonas quercus]|uniref:Coenzyme PQQ synthesis protein B n=1 Tax=Sphingomonas quercus TaxID=2842451 RepID=A0ABS6BGS9_9SPHN|nr:pyrroloquinoline quinone biosynthesis protein PqqB [Sphingomonas quercus]MBU3076686.1 pyrroloquinoline quinone biosynthesis protein PqqB [Sphingomonas quercus]